MNNNRKKTFFLTVILLMPVVTVNTVFAATGYDTWLAPFSSLVDSMINFMGIIGKALLAWAIFEVATALFSHDTSQMPQALRRIGAGTLLIFIQTIITAMAGGGATTTPTTPPSGGVQTAMLMDMIDSIRYMI